MRARLDLEDALEAICADLADYFSVPQTGIGVLNETCTAVKIIAEHKSEESNSAVGIMIPVEGNPATQYVIEHGKPLAIYDAIGDPRMAPVHDLMCVRNVASILLVPLFIRDDIVGTIGLDSNAPRLFS